MQMENTAGPWRRYALYSVQLQLHMHMQQLVSHTNTNVGKCKFACRCRCEAQLTVLEVKHTFAPFDCGSDFTGQSSPKRNSQSQDVDLLFALSCAYIGRELEVDLGAERSKHMQLESSPNLSGASWRSHKVCFYMNTINMMIDGLQGYM